MDLPGGLRPGDEGHAELLAPQQLDVGLGHRPPHPAELRARAGLGRGRGAPHAQTGGGRGVVPPALPAPLTMPSSGATLFCTGCSNSTLPSGSLKRTRLGRPSLWAPRGSARTPTWSPSSPAPPLLSTGHRGALGRAHRGHPEIWGGGGQEKDDILLGSQAPRSAHPCPRQPDTAKPLGASSARVHWAPPAPERCQTGTEQEGVPAGRGGGAGPVGSRVLGPGCKLGRSIFGLVLAPPGRSWKLVTTLLCKGAWKRGRAEETGAGRREGEERLQHQRASGEGTARLGDPGGRAHGAAVVPVTRCAHVPCRALDLVPFVPAPDLEAKG